jgi:uncharacterized protein YjbI with pentapeptide repeats
MSRLWQILARIGWRVWAAMTSLRLWKVTGGFAFSLAIVIGLVVAVQIVPEWQVNRAGVHSAPIKTEATATAAEVANLQNEMRKTILQVLGGLFAIFALYLTFRRVKVAEQGHITDRYTKAIEQLGATKEENKPNVEVRLGAIYALERIAQDSPRDHWTIMEVLTAYVRQNAPAPEQTPTKEENEKAIAKGPAKEIQAILTVLGRRRRDHRREIEGQWLDLRYSDLRGANFDTAHMEGTSFEGAHLYGSTFDGAHLERANFFEAHAEWAIFARAHVEDANFAGAQLENTYFGTAHLKDTNFYNAHLDSACFHFAHFERTWFEGAHIERAEFRDAVGLTVNEILTSIGWEKAKFDEKFLQKLKAADEEDASQLESSFQAETQSSESRTGEGG